MFLASVSLPPGPHELLRNVESHISSVSSTHSARRHVLNHLHQHAAKIIYRLNSQKGKHQLYVFQTYDLSHAYHASSGISHLRIPVEDIDYADLLIWLPHACAFIDSALRCGGKVLVHCVQGLSRSAAVVCAYRMSSQPSCSIVQCY